MLTGCGEHCGGLLLETIVLDCPFICFFVKMSIQVIPEVRKS